MSLNPKKEAKIPRLLRNLATLIEEKRGQGWETKFDPTERGVFATTECVGFIAALVFIFIYCRVGLIEFIVDTALVFGTVFVLPYLLGLAAVNIRRNWEFDRGPGRFALKRREKAGPEPVGGE